MMGRYGPCQCASASTHESASDCLFSASSNAREPISLQHFILIIMPYMDGVGNDLVILDKSDWGAAGDIMQHEHWTESLSVREGTDLKDEATANSYLKKNKNKKITIVSCLLLFSNTMWYFHWKWTGHVTPSITSTDMQMQIKCFSDTCAIHLYIDLLINQLMRVSKP